MAFTAAGMKARYLAAIAGITEQTTADATGQSDAILLALFNAITDEIHENARCSGSDTGAWGGDSHDNVQIV